MTRRKKPAEKPGSPEKSQGGTSDATNAAFGLRRFEGAAKTIEEMDAAVLAEAKRSYGASIGGTDE